MKKLFEILFDENRSFEFPWWVYFFIVPILMVAIMGIAGWLETSCV